MSTYNWNEIKEALKRELKDKFAPKMNQYNFDFEEGIDLFGKFIVYKISDSDLDGQELVVLPNIDKFYTKAANRSDKLSILNVLSTSFDALLHKILYFSDNEKYNIFVKNRKGLKDYIVELGLLKTNILNVLYCKSEITDYNGFPKELQDTYYTRNKVHEAKNWNEQDIVKNITSCLVSYVATIFDYYNVLKPICDSTVIPVYQSNNSKDSDEYKKLKTLINKEKNKNAISYEDIELSQEFEEFLRNPNASFAHSKVNDVFLDDIYISPNVNCENFDKINKYNKTLNILELLEAESAEGINFAFIGEDLSGKTSLCKFLHKKYYNLNYVPIYVDGNSLKGNIRTNALQKIFKRSFEKQYKTAQVFDSIDPHKFIIIIDDFHKSNKGKQNYWIPLLRNINIVYKNIIITGDKLMLIETLVRPNRSSSVNIFKNFELYSLLEFGPKLRSRLVNKWNAIGIDFRLVEKNDILKNNDDSLKHIEKVIGNNYVPAYPFFILTLLQALENRHIDNPNYSIHGFYYELLINDSLKKAVENHKEISLYYNYMTHFSYYLFEKKSKIISISDFKIFHNLFSNKFEINYNLNKISDNLVKAKLIYINSDGIKIQHNYIYYFFVAKYLANNIRKENEKDIIAKMSQRIYRDEYSSIIMFLTHLSKDEFIIDKLLLNAKQIFEDSPVAKLEKDIDKINKLIKVLPKQVLEAIDVDDFREKELLAAEEVEKHAKIEQEADLLNFEDEEPDLDEDLNTIDTFTKFTLALKTIDLLGQIAKKYWGELTGNQKFRIISETYYVGLRALSFFLDYIQSDFELLVQHLKDIVKQNHLKDEYISQDDVKDVTNDFIFKMSFLTSWAIIKRISSAVGDKSLSPTFKRILNANSHNSIHLIDLAIKLDYNSSVPINDVIAFKKNRPDNFLSILILQNLVINHLYLFKTSYKMKARVCEVLGISIKKQLLIEVESKIKK